MTTKSMKTGTILRIASLLAALQYGAHASLFLLAAWRHGPGKLAAIAASRSHSYWGLLFWIRSACDFEWVDRSRFSLAAGFAGRSKYRTHHTEIDAPYSRHFCACVP